MDSGNPLDRLVETPPFFESWYTWIGILCVAVLAGIRTYLRGPQYFSQISLKDKVAVVTGGNRGIGFHIASELALRGARVYLGCRDEASGKEAIESIKVATKSTDVHLLPLTLGSLVSIQDFASALKKREDKLDILCHNAGVMVCPQSRTQSGVEYHLGVNYLGPYLLTQELTDLLKAATPSRIVCLTSAAYALGEMNWDDLNLEKREYNNGADAFSQSKLALMLLVNKLSRQLAEFGVTVNACHPGVARTDIHRYMPIKTSQFLYYSTAPLTWYVMKSAKDGAQTPLYLCIDEKIQDMTGKYFITASGCGVMAESVDRKQPFYKFDDNEPDKNYFCILLKVPELKTRKTIKLKDVTVDGHTVWCNFNQRSLEVQVSIGGPKESVSTTNYVFNIVKLPEEIDTEKSYYKVKQGSVYVYLRKVINASWEEYIGELEPA